MFFISRLDIERRKNGFNSKIVQQKSLNCILRVHWNRLKNFHFFEGTILLFFFWFLSQSFPANCLACAAGVAKTAFDKLGLTSWSKKFWFRKFGVFLFIIFGLWLKNFWPFAIKNGGVVKTKIYMSIWRFRVIRTFTGLFITLGFWAKLFLPFVDEYSAWFSKLHSTCS